MIIAKFVPSCLEAAYMEVFMDWWLIYRDEAAMNRLCKHSIYNDDYEYDITNTIPVPEITIAAICCEPVGLLCQSLPRRIDGTFAVG